MDHEDDEIIAMQKAGEALSGLSPEAARRVLRYLHDRFAPRLTGNPEAATRAQIDYLCVLGMPLSKAEGLTKNEAQHQIGRLIKVKEAEKSQSAKPAEQPAPRRGRFGRPRVPVNLNTPPAQPAAEPAVNGHATPLTAADDFPPRP